MVVTSSVIDRWGVNITEDGVYLLLLLALLFSWAKRLEVGMEFSLYQKILSLRRNERILHIKVTKGRIAE